MPEPTRQDADQLITAPKSIREFVSWKQTNARCYPHWTLEAAVVCFEPRADLRLRGAYGKTNWGFALLFDNYPIRRIGNHRAAHRNPDGLIVAGCHKHRWCAEHADRETYVPNDIDFSNVNQAFFDFLAECNITLTEQYQGIILFER